MRVIRSVWIEVETFRYILHKYFLLHSSGHHHLRSINRRQFECSSYASFYCIAITSISIEASTGNLADSTAVRQETEGHIQYRHN